MKIPPVDVTQRVAPSQLRHECALPRTDRWDDETGSERPGASLKGPVFLAEFFLVLSLLDDKQIPEENPL